jgi:predicted  nucleic acid-binding Zn ribbon protein
MREEILHCDLTDEPTIHTAAWKVYYTLHMQTGIHYHEWMDVCSRFSAAWKNSYTPNMREDALIVILTDEPPINTGAWKVLYTIHMQ